MATDIIMLDLVNELAEFFPADDPRATTWERIARSKIEKLQAMLAKQVEEYDAWICSQAPDPDVPAMYISANWGHD